jgi:RNA polymerase sigma-70 factor, ECF subfamily
MALRAHPAPGKEAGTNNVAALLERNTGEHTVQALVARAQGGDQAALTELYQQFAPRIQGYLARQLASSSASVEAEDLTAEVFARVIEKIGGYEDRGLPFTAWLFRIAHNVLIDHHRRKPKVSLSPIEDAYEVHEVGSFKELDSRFTRHQVGGAIGLLTDDQREVVELRFLKGLNMAETAQMVGKSEDAVKKLQARGLAALRRALECQSGCWRVVLDSSPA